MPGTILEEPFRYDNDLEVASGVKKLAEHLIALAKTEVHEALGNRSGGVRIAENWRRSEAVWEF